jgi:hypothetical protein
MAMRPKTMREIQAENVAKAGKGEVRILNISKQTIPIHLKPPKGVDFYVGAQDVRLGAGKSHMFRKSRLWLEQVERLEKQRRIQVLYDSEKAAEKAEKAAQ